MTESKLVKVEYERRTALLNALGNHLLKRTDERSRQTAERLEAELREVLKHYE